VLELEPAVLEAARFFDPLSGRPLADPRVQVVADDARTYTAYTREKFDVVISEPSNPWMTGASSLFTQEHFRAVRSTLRPGGRLMQWVHVYSMDLDGLRSVLAALRSVFPDVYLVAHSYDSGDLLLLATLEPLSRRELPRWQDLSEHVRDDLERIGTFSTEDLWSLVRLLPEDVRTLVGESAVANTDDNLRIELRSPWLLYADTFEENWQALGAFPTGVVPLIEQLEGPLGADALGRLAHSYAARWRDPRVAETLIQSALRAGPSAAALTARVSLDRALGSRALLEQLAALDQARALDPDYKDARLLRLQLLVDLERYDEALRESEELVRALPDDPRARALRAVTLRALDQDLLAAAALEELLSSPYGVTDAANPLRIEAARAYYATQRPADAARHLETYIDHEPLSARHWMLLATAYRAAGRASDAERAEGIARELEQWRASP
jgi:spermidine synthase